MKKTHLIIYKKNLFEIWAPFQFGLEPILPHPDIMGRSNDVEEQEEEVLLRQQSDKRNLSSGQNYNPRKPKGYHIQICKILLLYLYY